MRRTHTAAAAVALMAAAILFFVGSAPASAAQASAGWSWTDYSRTLNDVSCATPGLCVGVGQEGMVLHTTADPANPLAWSTIPGVTTPAQLVAVACTTSLCLAVADDDDPAIGTTRSRVFGSLDGGATWSAGVTLPVVKVDGVNTSSAADIACDPSGTCYVVGLGGGVWRSTDHGASWTALSGLPAAGTYRQVACPADGTCVAIGGTAKSGGSVAVIDGTTATAVPVPTTFQKGTSAVGCDQPSRCIVTDGVDHYAAIALPGRAFGAVAQINHAAAKPDVAITRLSCPAPGTCVGQGAGYVLRTTTLSSDKPVWNKRPLNDGLTKPLKAISCVQATCVSAGAKATWFASTDTAFTFTPVNQLGSLAALQCLPGTSGVCVGGGGHDVSTTRDGGTLWTSPLFGADLNIAVVRCSDPTTCLLLGTTAAFYTTDMNNFGPRFSATFGPAPAAALACVDDRTCLSASGGATTMTLDGGATLWGKTPFPGGMSKSAYCMPGKTDPITCVVVGTDGILRGTATITDGKPRWSWVAADVDAPNGLTAVACSPGGQCTAVGPGASVFTSDGPLLEWADHSIQRDVKVDDRADLTVVTCPADGSCVVGGAHGARTYIASTITGWADYQLDQIGPIGASSPTIAGISCDTATHCVLVGDDAIVGYRSPAA